MIKRNFWNGFSSVFNIFGNYKKFDSSKSGHYDDYKAIKSDWDMVGRDIKKSIEEKIDDLNEIITNK